MKDLRASIIKSIRENFPESQQEEIINMINGLSDDEIKGFDVAYPKEDINFMNEDESSKLFDSIKCSKPTNLIELKNGAAEKLIDLWYHDDDYFKDIPSDIFFGNTIPIMDILIDYEYEGDDAVFKTHVIIFHDYKDRILASDFGNLIKVGVVIDVDGDNYNRGIAAEIMIRKGSDKIFIEPKFGHKLPNLKKEYLSNYYCNMQILDLVVLDMRVWYGVQIALLHPIIKDVFKNPSRAVYNSKPKAGKKKKTLKYIKKHAINGDNIEKIVSNSKYNRHTLCWYVIGHWRTYKNGKRIFIKPYWKGILRDTKTVDEICKREIVTELDS